MNLDNIYTKYELNIKSLAQKGFIKENNFYKKRINLNNNFEVEIILSKEKGYIKVYDKELEEEYLPFYAENAGEFASGIKEEVKKIVEEIVKQCFVKVSLQEQLIDYVKEKYKTVPDYPFSNDKISKTFKTSEGKWYSILMEVPYKSLKINKEGTVTILNLKNTAEKVKSLIDNKYILKAYHMNKKYWITILLVKGINLDKVKKLIDESYNLVKNKKKS